VRKHRLAIKGRDESKAAFEDLDAKIDETSLWAWREEEQEAMENRGESLRIYEVQIEKGLICISCFLVSSLIEVRFSPISS
jgi:hypothetical protein